MTLLRVPAARCARSMFTAVAATVLLAGSLAPIAGQAATRTVDFEVLVDPNGTSLAGQTLTGRFRYDDATGSGLHPTVFALTFFQFSFANATYELTDLDFAEAWFDGTLAWGLEAVSQDLRFSFVSGGGDYDPYFAFDLGAGNAGFGGVRTRAATVPPRTVPEPGGWLLAALALAGLGLSRWRSAGVRTPL